MFLKTLAKAALTRFPDDGRWVKRMYHHMIQANRYRTVRRRQQRGSWRLPPQDHVLWLSPDRIRLHTNLRTNGAPPKPADRVFGLSSKIQVAGGDWDLGGIDFEELEAFKSIKAHMTEGTEWRQTGFYREILADIEAGTPQWGCHNAADLDRRCEYIDSVIASVRRYGLLAHKDVGPAQDATGGFSDEIEVNVGRDGEFLFQDGRHRLAIAKILGLTRIPVKIRVRHLEWQKFREYLFSMAEHGGATSDGALYQSPVHPDLNDIPAAHVCEDRLAFLLPHVQIHQGRLLDIGCNLAFFCHHFEQAGLDCTGIELDPETAHVARRIARSEHRRFRILSGDVLSPEIHDPLLAQPYNVVLALNVLHHFMKTKEDYERLRIFLKKLQPRQMLFEPHRTDESQMQGVYANLSERDFVAFVQENAGLPHAEHIHTASDGRMIFSLHH
ncbi:MAG: methyltransferase [Rhodoferax sp.]